MPSISVAVPIGRRPALNLLDPLDRLTPARTEAILESAQDVLVLVAGDLMLDTYISGSVERISPEAPVPVVRVEEESHAVGGAANVAANVVALGASCQLVGCRGDDLHGELLVRELHARGVRTDGVLVTERATTVKTRVIARRQQVVRVDREVDGDHPEEVGTRLQDAISELVSTARVVVLEDYNKGVLLNSVIRAALDEASASGLPTVVDPKQRRFFAYGGATVFKPNAKELEDALGQPLDADDPEWMEAARKRIDCDNLLLTLGERGMALQTGSGDHVRAPTTAREVYDVSGAGDTVTAVVAVALGAGATVTEAALLANLAAAVEVGKAGVATVLPEEILRHQRTILEGD